MNVLAIDTATEACSAALAVDGRVLARFEAVGRSHTERLAPMVLGLMAEAGIGFSALDGYVCGVGPGSFAGVRIGVGYLKGLALAVDRPVVGVSSLAMLALPLLRAGAPRVLCAIDARMNEVYLGGYAADADGLPRPLAEAGVCAPAAASAVEPGVWWGAGSGWARYETELRAATGAQLQRIDAAALPRAEDALTIGVRGLAAGQGGGADALAPVYLRNKVALTLEEQRALRR